MINPGGTKPEAGAREASLIVVGRGSGALEPTIGRVSQGDGETGVALVTVHHLDPTHAIALVEILGRATAMRLATAQEGVHLEANHVYVVTPAANVLIEDGVLRIVPRVDGRSSCNDAVGPRGGSPKRKPLTPREREVLQLLAEGKASKDIAAILTIALPTVETHRRQLMAKLALKTIAELTKFAIREGLTTVDR